MQVFYHSKDGTSIPMFICHKKGLSINKNTPTLLYGYGGFNTSITPSPSSMYLLWMEQGGIIALPNIRGGGEYGEEWHRAGMLKNKQTVFDDFIAAAQWLIDNGYTSPKKLAIAGRSNGGLLTGACITQHPELFGAAIVGVGVLDMLRFHLFTIGWAWISEYGSPDDPELFPILHSYSPYHHVRRSEYPPTLITTGLYDDRVSPLHSFKFAAALQENCTNSSPILLFVNTLSGHGAGKSLSQEVEENAYTLLFLFEEIGEK
jgi:prolyl oligopeptidase